MQETVNPNHGLILFNPEINPYQELQLWARVDLGVMAMKGYSAFPKALALLEPHHQIVYYHIQDTPCGGDGGGGLPLCRGAVQMQCHLIGKA